VEPACHSTPVKVEVLVDVEPEAAVKAEGPQEDPGMKTEVQQQKPGRPRLHRRQQSLFLPSAMRRSLVSTLNADPAYLMKLNSLLINR
jgi:hypothetical protein